MEKGRTPYYFFLQSTHRINFPFVSRPSLDWLPRLLLLTHYAFHLINMIVSDPQAHVSTGVHQTVSNLNFFSHELQEYFCYPEGRSM